MTTPTSDARPSQEALYTGAAEQYGASLVRLARSYETDADLRQDLLQEIHLALWRSFATFDGACSQRTWVYRVAHNAAASHVLKYRRQRARNLVSLDDIELPAHDDPAELVERQLQIEQLAALVRQLKPLDRQITVLYLEGLDAASIAEVTGMSSNNVATKIHRIKKMLAARSTKESR